MPPQPLSRVGNVNHISIGPKAFTRCGHLAKLVLEYINVCSHAEATIAEIMATCLKSKTEIGLTMYHATISSEARQAMVRAVIATSLSKRDQVLFERIISVYKPVRDRRNDFAHHLWADSSDVSDALILIDPRHELTARVVWAKVEKTGRIPRATINNFLGYDFDKMFVYRKADLERDLKAADDSHFHLKLFQRMLTQKGGERAHTRTLLKSLPEFRKPRARKRR